MQLLNAIQLFGANLDDYLHLLLPPIVKLFDAPDVPLQARKSVPHAARADPHILLPVNHELTLEMGKLLPPPGPPLCVLTEKQKQLVNVSRRD